MKHTITLISVTTLAFVIIALLMAPFEGRAAEFEFVASDNSTETQTCLYAVTDDLSGLKRTVRTGFDGNYKLMSHILKCNDQDINSFTAAYGAKNTSAFLNRRVSAKYKVDDSVDIIDISQVGSDKYDKIIVYVTSK